MYQSHFFHPILINTEHMKLYAMKECSIKCDLNLSVYFYSYKIE